VCSRITLAGFRKRSHRGGPNESQLPRIRSIQQRSDSGVSVKNSGNNYQPTWESVRTHPLPDWFDQAKLGIFFHWGLYSVPAWAPALPDIQALLRDHPPSYLLANNPYAEWYLNTMSIEGSPTSVHHHTTYGDSFEYDDFRPAFEEASAGADLDELAELCVASGAGYSVLTTKHHEGYCLWPSTKPHPAKGEYHSERDLVGDYCDAMRRAGIRPGLYYSGGFDWPFNGAVMDSIATVLEAAPQSPEYAQYATAHVTELIDRYRPDVLWNDISFPHEADLAAVFAHFYNTVPDGVINDRWSQVPPKFGPRVTSAIVKSAGFMLEHLWRLIPDGKKVLASPRGHHYDFTTPEYSSPDAPLHQKWEATRGVGHSFGANHNEPEADILSPDEVLPMFIDIVAKGGNLLLGVGPAPDGKVPEVQQRPLRALGEWLSRNGTAIRGTHPAAKASEQIADGTEIRYTAKGNTLHAVILTRPNGATVNLSRPPGGTPQEVRQVDGGAPLDSSADSGHMAVTLPDSAQFPFAISMTLDGEAEGRPVD